MIGALRLPLHRRIVAPTLRFAGFTPPKQISNSSAMNAKFSPGEDGDQLTKETKTLLEETKWRLTDAQTGLEKTFYFKTFTKVLDFTNVVGVRCKSKNHHPRMTIETGSVSILWTTHNPRGLSSKDTFMARYCDKQAQLIGDVDKDQAQKCGSAPSAQI